MNKIKLPYHKRIMEVKIKDENLKDILDNEIGSLKEKMNEKDIVMESLAKPIGTENLRDLAKGKDKVLIVTSDHTRSVPSKITLPLLLSEIRGGNPEVDITIIIATGLHRATTEVEQRSMFGDEIVNNENIVVHDAFDDQQMRYICELPSGASFAINKLALESNLIVCEGFIEPHFFAGFSGGRKSILPGICSAVTVNENHSFKAIEHEKSRTGVLDGNIIHEDMIYASKKIGVDFILNLVLDSEKKIIASFAGDLEEAHELGCEFITKLSEVSPSIGDIVITSNGGYPLDQNLYQCVKAVSTAERCLAEDGIIILVASCIDGMGGSNFEKLMLSGSPQNIYDKLMKILPKETIPEQWSAQIFSKIMLNHQIILVTDNLSSEFVGKLNMIHATTAQDALRKAFKIKGEDASVVVVPDGVSVMVV